MGWNLPPGVSDKDVDDAAPQNEPDDEDLIELVECEWCGKHFEFDYDNEEKGSNGAVYFCCDGCIELGLHRRLGRRGDGDL